MVRFKLSLTVVAFVMMIRCGENTVSIGDPPPMPQFSIDKSDPNVLVFKLISAEGFMFNWNFGNGTLSKDSIDTIYYPFADTYTVKLTASNKGGATTAKEKVVIAKTDPKICENRFYELLTGGCNVGTKTWKFDSANGALANGGVSGPDAQGKPASSYNDVISTWWTSLIAGIANDPLSPPTPPRGALDDEYVFTLKGFKYKNDCHGEFFFNYKWANQLFGLTQEQYHDTVHAYTPNDPATWKLDIDTTTPEIISGNDSTTWKRRFFVDSATSKRFNLILTLSNENYLGYCSGTSTYQILRINSDTMTLRHELLEPKDPSIIGANRKEWRYLRLVAKK
jgi:PKD repeat protein